MIACVLWSMCARLFGCRQLGVQRWYTCRYIALTDVTGGGRRALQTQGVKIIKDRWNKPPNSKRKLHGQIYVSRFARLATRAFPGPRRLKQTSLSCYTTGPFFRIYTTSSGRSSHSSSHGRTFNAVSGRVPRRGRSPCKETR